MDKILENLFFAATEPLTIRQLSQILQLDSPEEIEGLKTSLERLSKEYQNRGLQLLEVAGGYQLATQADYAKWIRLLRKTVPTPLTEEARVSLAIIAYKQPITRSEIEELRGVDCESVLNTLVAKGLVQSVGELSGGAYLYSTTQQFLKQFVLNSLSDLPRLQNKEPAQ